MVDEIVYEAPFFNIYVGAGIINSGCVAYQREGRLFVVYTGLALAQVKGNLGMLMQFSDAYIFLTVPLWVDAYETKNCKTTIGKKKEEL